MRVQHCSSGRRWATCGLFLSLWIGGIAQADEPPPAAADRWPLFRGNAAATGVTAALLPEQLSVLWRQNVEGAVFEATAAISEDRVFLADVEGRLLCLSLVDGELQWTFASELGFSTAPAVFRNKVYVGDFDGKFFCVDAATGRKLWEFSANAEINSSANFFGDTVLFGSQDATLYALDADTGDLAWEYTIDDQIRCSPSIIDGVGFLAGCDARLHVVDLQQGTPVRTVDLDGPTGVTAACHGDHVYFGTESGTVFAVNWKSGTVTWTYQDPEKQLPIRSSPAVYQGVVVYGGHDKKVTALNVADGSRRWEFSTKYRVESSPVVANDRVYVAAGDGRLYVLRLDDGTLLGEYELGGRVTASPAVVNQRLVIANDEGHVVCLGGTD